jgi:hypothetical protein
MLVNPPTQPADVPAELGDPLAVVIFELNTPSLVGVNSAMKRKLLRGSVAMLEKR